MSLAIWLRAAFQAFSAQWTSGGEWCRAWAQNPSRRMLTFPRKTFPFCISTAFLWISWFFFFFWSFFNNIFLIVNSFVWVLPFHACVHMYLELETHTVLQCLAVMLTAQKGRQVQVSPGLFYVEFLCSPRIHVGSLQLLWHPPTVQRHAFGAPWTCDPPLREKREKMDGWMETNPNIKSTCIVSQRHLLF